MHQAVIYLRVSTIEQTTANQERELREIAVRMGCEIVKVYKDHGISGAKGRDKRPEAKSVRWAMSSPPSTSADRTVEHHLDVDFDHEIVAVGIKTSPACQHCTVPSAACLASP
jgi:Resolvase, N terminal domain